ncbi:MAG: 3-deoxy-D-manno-octulosonic acid transferase [Candidatus Omnitrophota bacterium]
MFIIFDIFYLILLFFYLPVLGIKRKLHRGYKMRMGFLSDDLKRKLSSKPNIWLHAVSVGEVLAIADLVEKLKEKFPEKQIVCSVVTKTGYQIANQKLGKGVVVVYAPLDFSFVVGRFIRNIRPEIYILAETEIWPNLFHFLNHARVPIIQVNGRISDKSYSGYKRVGFITKAVLSNVKRFCMQSQTDAERIIHLGARPETVSVIGNLKFDNLPGRDDSHKSGLTANDRNQWLIAGSTHPGEEEIVLDSFVQLKRKYDRARLILCPRHVERTADIHSLIKLKQLCPVNLSVFNQGSDEGESIIVVDTIGQLRSLYKAAKVVIIGKTFRVGGGQNMIEPASFGKPVIVGPLTYNFKDIVDLLSREKALVQVSSSDELTEELIDLWGNAVRCQSLGMAAQRVVEKYKGATSKTVREIELLLMR